MQSTLEMSARGFGVRNSQYKQMHLCFINTILLLDLILLYPTAETPNRTFDFTKF
jgi:hypothetical protein